MATEQLNQRICRVPPEKDTAFKASTPSAGSLYFRPSESALTVGDGETKGGVDFMSRAWVLQKIEEANWKANQEKEVFKISVQAYNPGLISRTAKSTLGADIWGSFNATATASGSLTE